MKKNNLTSLSDFIDGEIGPKGTKKRQKFDEDYETSNLGCLFSKPGMKKD